MPYIPPSNERDQPPKRSAGGVGALVQAEKLMQIAFVLPCAMLLGWGAGWWIDHHFHVKWATPVGLIFGVIAGMVSGIRMALDAGGGAKSKAGKS